MSLTAKATIAASSAVPSSALRGMPGASGGSGAPPSPSSPHRRSDRRAWSLSSSTTGAVGELRGGGGQYDGGGDRHDSRPRRRPPPRSPPGATATHSSLQWPRAGPRRRPRLRRPVAGHGRDRRPPPAEEDEDDEDGGEGEGKEATGGGGRVDSALAYYRFRHRGEDDRRRGTSSAPDFLAVHSLR